LFQSDTKSFKVKTCEAFFAAKSLFEAVKPATAQPVNANLDPVSPETTGRPTVLILKAYRPVGRLMNDVTTGGSGWGC